MSFTPAFLFVLPLLASWVLTTVSYSAYINALSINIKIKFIVNHLLVAGCVRPDIHTIVYAFILQLPRAFIFFLNVGET